MLTIWGLVPTTTTTTTTTSHRRQHGTLKRP